jgi:PAS domain S-box-containing protein
MKFKIILALLLLPYTVIAQHFDHEQHVETTWDQGIPLCPEDAYITGLIEQLDPEFLTTPNKPITKKNAKLCREIAIAFYNREMYDAADWYLYKAKTYVEVVEIQPETIVKQLTPEISDATAEQLKSLQQDAKFLESIPDSYDQLNETQIKQLAERIDKQIQKLTTERAVLVKNKASKDVIDAKDKTIDHLEKEKHVIDLTVKENVLKKQTSILKTERQTLYRYLVSTGAVIAVLILLISYIALRKRVAYKESVILKQKNRFNEFEQFVDSSVLVSKTDAKGRITYVNEKFQQVSGWTADEAMGQDHRIVNSGYHNREYWQDMYDTVLRQRKIWNGVVTNKNKSGELYWVDSYIKAEFDEKGQLQGFTSIRYDVTDVVKSAQEIEKQNTYLEHAAKILRHDMHSGINTYIPRGVNSLERRLTDDTIKNLKLEAPLKMIKEGLTHTQKVYKGVYEFTNLVKKDVVLNKTTCDLKQILESYLTSTSYKSQVILEDLGNADVNEPLFCTAVDNLIRNGLKYNDSSTKFVKIYIENGDVVIQDNGRGLTQDEFNHLSKPYTRKPGQKETGTGLGLNICVAILTEHGFKISCDKNEIGTKIKIKLGTGND